MRHFSHCIIMCLLLVGVLSAAADLETLALKCPSGTIGIIATSGTDDFGPAFQNSILGQIISDPQVKSFLDQLSTSLSKTNNDWNGPQAKTYIDFAKLVFRSPSILAMRIDPENLSADPTLVLISKTVTDPGEFNTAMENMLKPQLESTKMQKQVINGSTVYLSASPNQCEPFYLAQTGNFFVVAVNDKDMGMLSNGGSNVELAAILQQVPPSQEAIIAYFDMQKIISFLEKESGEDAQKIRAVLQSLGLSDLQYSLMHSGFEGSGIVVQSRMKVSTGQGIWNALSPADRSLFNYVDPKAMQACAAHVDPEVVYDTILHALLQAGPETAIVPAKIAQAEALLDFKIRDDLLANIEGSFLGYMLPAYASPELLSGGYVMLARLKDAQKVETCLLHLGNVIQSIGQQQVQVTSQQSADGKPIHIWAVTVMAMAQIIPSWAIEGDTLIFTSHPNLTKNVMARVASGQQDSIASDPRFETLLKTVPADAFVISLTDSQASARQLMQGLQQVWPMLNIGLIQQGIQLPIMLPSIESHIAKMEPGLRYSRKTADGIENYYQGTGLEVSMGGAVGAGMAAAIVMPALSKTKQVAQRTVSATNLKSIGLASIVYANDHEGRYPSNLEDLIAEADLSAKSLENPRKLPGCEGPDYVLVQGLTNKAVVENMVLAYENPACVGDDKVNVLYADGHVAVESQEALKLNLQKTYEHLGKPMPDVDWDSK